MHVRTTLLASLLLTACGSSDASTSDAGAAALHYQRITLAVVSETDPQAAFAWYRDVLGLPPGPGSTDGFELGDGSTFEINAAGVSSGPPKSPAQQSAVVAVQVADLDSTAMLLEQRGVHFTGGVETDGDARAIEFTDWEGNRVQIRELAGDGDDFGSLPWACLYVEDLDASLSWYGEMLGLGASAISGSGSARRAQLRLENGAVLELRAGGSASDQPKTPAQQSITLGLQVQDLDAARATLQARGIDIQPGASARVVDPEGNLLLLYAAP